MPIGRVRRIGQRGRRLPLAWIALAWIALAIGAAMIAGPALADPGPDASSRAAASPYGPYVSEAAARFELSEGLILAVMRTESGGNPRAISPAGAMGLMQIMPATWPGLSAQHRLGADPFDIRANILAGAAYLRAMLDRYGDPGIALAAYNAGPRRVDDWRAGTQSLPAETVAYVARIARAGRMASLALPARDAIMPRDWRGAALFAPRADRASDGAPLASDAQVSGSAPTPSSVSHPSLSPHFNPLFAPLSDRTAR